MGAEPDDYFDYEFFRKNWRWRNYHITKQRLNFFDPIFNDSQAAHAISNKCKFYERWSAFLNRKWCIPQNITFEEFEKQFADCNRILIKPASGYGGKGIYDIFLTEENMYSVNENNSNCIFNILKGTAISIVITFALLIIFSAILTYTSVNENTMPAVIIIVTALSILIGSQVTTSKMKKNGIVNGILVGGIYFVFLYILSSIISKNFTLNNYSIIMMATNILLGGRGGIIGVNKK